MSTNAPSSGPNSTPQPVDQVWVDQSVEVLQQNRPLAPAQRVLQLRELVKGRSLDELQSLAERIGGEGVALSQNETQALAVRVRELLSSRPAELNELAESRNRDRRLEILGQRSALLALVSQHFQPGIGSKIAGGFERAYQRIISAPNAIGDFFRRQGEQLARRAPNRRVAFANQMKKGFYLSLEFPSFIEKFVPVPAFLSRFAHKFRERRTRIEAEEQIYMVLNSIRTQGDPKVPFIEFEGFDLGTFEKLKEKHLAKDAEGNVASEEFTEKARTAILRDVSKATLQVVKNKRDPEKGGNASLGTAEDKVLKIAMADLLNPEADVEAHAEEETTALKKLIAESGVWGSRVVSSVEFGTAYEFSRADSTLTIPREAIDGNGAPITDQGRSLQAALSQLPVSVKKIAVVGAKENLVLGDEVQLPLNRPETPAQIASFVSTVQANPRISIMRSTQNQTMLGSFRYIGEGGRGVLEWNDNLAQVADVQGFLATNGILDDARPMDEWRPNTDPNVQGDWEKIART